MIVKMKKAILLCLDSDKVKALEALRELGVMHVDIAKRPDTSDCDSVAKDISAVERVASLLGNYKPAATAPALSGEETVRKASSLLDAESAALKKLETLLREEERIAPWGSFDPKSVEALKAKGVNVYLCIGSASDMKSVPEGASATLVSEVKGATYYAVVSEKPLDPLAIRAVALPSVPLREVEAQIAKIKTELDGLKKELGFLAANAKALASYRAGLLEKLDFLSHRDFMSVSGSVAYFQGYVPAPAEEKMAAAAKANGWGLLLSDPEDEDMPPTLLENPKWMKVIEPLFQMIGISPGYREFDVTLFFLIFFTVFFGMIVADAGYALGFLAIAVLARFLVKDPKMKVPLNLFTLLSLSALAWGWLNGVFFGILPEKLPFAFMRGLKMFSDPAASPFACELAHKYGVINDALYHASQNFSSIGEEEREALRKAMEPMPDKFTQWFCFLLAALHLSGARLFRVFAEIKHNWRAVGDLGWALIIWGNFFTAVQLIVFNGSFPSFGVWLYVAAIVLIVGSIDWHDTGHAMHMPFALIGSFVDVLSYIRLFAVGMSGLFIAKCFNNMGGMACDALPSSLAALGLLFAIFVIAFGHFLNIALAFLGVLVHAIRLNALEFSNQMELQWTGVKYKPFAKENSSTNQG